MTPIPAQSKKIADLISTPAGRVQLANAMIKPLRGRGIWTTVASFLEMANQFDAHKTEELAFDILIYADSLEVSAKRYDELAVVSYNDITAKEVLNKIKEVRTRALAVPGVRNLYEVSVIMND